MSQDYMLPNFEIFVDNMDCDFAIEGKIGQYTTIPRRGGEQSRTLTDGVEDASAVYENVKAFA